MDIVALVYMPLFGLAVGSFLNLTIDRLPRGQSVVTPPSRCDRCERRLAPFELVPVFSYLFLRGKCRRCGVPIPARNVVMELATAALFGFVTYRFGLTPLGGVILAYGTLFLAISAIDFEWTIILDKMVLPGAVLAFAAAHYGPVGEDNALGETFIRVVAGGGLGFGVMFLIYIGSFLVYRSNVGLGFGDVKLAGLMGLVLGFPDLAIALYFAFIAGGVVALLLICLKLRGRRDALPYGPFLAGGPVATLLVSKNFGWYLNLLG